MKLSVKLQRKDAITLLLFVLIVVGIRTWQHRDMPHGLAPSLSGSLLNGSSYTLPVHPERPMLVHFWATWCPICKTEQNSVESIAHDPADTITIAMQSGKPGEVMRHMSEQQLHFPVLNDPDGSLSAAWGVHAVPASFILGTDGTIHFIEVGYTSEIGLRLRLWLAQWL